jgi:tetratricopeptide (TPR) repeat protein
LCCIWVVCAAAVFQAFAERRIIVSPCPEAEAAYREGRFADAAQIVSDALRSGGEAPALLLMRGMAYEMTGKNDKARSDYETALRIEPDNYKAMEALAGILERSGQRMDEAAQLYARAAQLDPRPVWKENAAVWAKMLESRRNREETSAVHVWNLGIDAMRAGDSHKAIGLFSRAIELDPQMPQAYISRAMVKARLEKLADALEDINEGLLLDRGYPGGLVLRGMTWEALGDSQKALDDYSAAIDVSPRDALGHLHKGRMLERAGNYSAAVRCYKDGLKLKPKRELAKDIEERLSALTKSPQETPPPAAQPARKRRNLR